MDLPSLSLADFDPSRAAGLARLEAFLPAAGPHYRDRRNFDFGPSDRSNVSALSPWLRHRLVSEAEVCAAVIASHGLAASEAFIREVFWRTYWKGWLEMRPSVWTDYWSARDRALATLADEPARRRAHDAAIDGRSGIDCLDAWATELVETGYLHNHARMWFASIWIFTLRLPWVLGADFFLRHLIDGDPASNTLSWRWVAGLQTRGKTYLATADNIARFTGGRFSPRGLAADAPPLDEPPLPAPIPIAPAGRAEDGPALVVVTEEDCLPETLPGLPREIAGALAVSSISGRSPGAVGQPAARFAEGALSDALSRMGHGGGAIVSGEATPQAVVSAVRDCGARQVVTADAPVGPARDLLDRLAYALKAEGIPLVRLRRDWDSRAWPHATRGFFAFKEQIPALLGAAGIATGVPSARRRKG